MSTSPIHKTKIHWEHSITCSHRDFRYEVWIPWKYPFLQHEIQGELWNVKNLYAGQEATVRTGHGTTDWFEIGKGVCQGCILSSCLFNLAEYIIRNAGLEEVQAGIKTAGRNINNLRYADYITLMAESEEELKSLLMKVRVRRVKKLA